MKIKLVKFIINKLKKIFYSFDPRIKKFEEFKSSNGFKRIYHIHIRKCAGTSINKAFISSLGGSEITYDALSKSLNQRLLLNKGPLVGWNRYLINKGAFFYGFSHEPYHKLIFDKETFTFTFLREPMNRVISHYNMLKDLIIKKSNHPALIAEKSWAYGDFDQFLKNIPKKHLENQLFTFSKKFIVKEALTNLKKISYVGKVEDIERLFIPKINKEFNLNLNYKPLRKSKSKVILTEDQIKYLRNLLKLEIEFYNEACLKFCK